jgi:2-polyprenyl-6-methoxyphenol hydroxylase-like FAD-dependent oxidoreductase
MIFDLGAFVLVGGVPGTNLGRGGFCPRRTVLDKLLVDAAVEAGAELREEFSAQALMWDANRVTGIKGASRGGRAVEERARLVIGADGVHSMVAEAVSAREYDTKPPLATYYYSYYSGFDADDIEQHFRDYRGVGCFPTHDGFTLIAGVWPSPRFEQLRADIEQHTRELHETTPSVKERLQAARRETKWFGTAGVANYFRQPYGPGWALVGDAGYDKDPITAQGISDAFIDADALATALDEGWSGRRRLGDVMAEYHSTRDRRAKPMYDFTCQLATLDPPAPPLAALFAALRGNRPAIDDFFSAITGSRPLAEYMNPQNIGRIITEAADVQSRTPTSM